MNFSIVNSWEYIETALQYNLSGVDLKDGMLAYDGDWETTAYAITENGVMYINYSIYSNITNIEWQVMDNYGKKNKTIPINCFNHSKMELRWYQEVTSNQIFYSCKNFTGDVWTDFIVDTPSFTNSVFYEEGIYINMSSISQFYLIKVNTSIGLIPNVQIILNNFSQNYYSNPAQINRQNLTNNSYYSITAIDLDNNYATKNGTFLYLANESSYTITLDLIQKNIMFSDATSGLLVSNDGIVDVFEGKTAYNLTYLNSSDEDFLYTLFFNNITNFPYNYSYYTAFKQSMEFYPAVSTFESKTFKIFSKLDDVFWVRTLSSDNSPIPKAEISLWMLNGTFNKSNSYGLSSIRYTDKQGYAEFWVNYNYILKMDFKKDGYNDETRYKILQNISQYTYVNPLVLTFDRTEIENQAFMYYLPNYVRNFASSIYGWASANKDSIILYTTNYRNTMGFANKTARTNTYSTNGVYMTDNSKALDLIFNEDFIVTSDPLSVYIYVNGTLERTHTITAINASIQKEVLKVSELGIDSNIFRIFLFIGLILIVIIMQFFFLSSSLSIGFHTFMIGLIALVLLDSSFWPSSTTAVLYYFMNRVKKFTGVTP